MAVNLNTKQRKAFVQIAYAVGSLGGATKDKIVVIGMRKDERDQYIEFFCKKKLCEKTDDIYNLTGLGRSMFNVMRNRYEKEGTFTSYRGC
jgi:hypothetical protein